jgi:hypothetical protein
VSIQDCADACSASPECQAYSYDSWNRFCILKNGISSLTLNAKSTAGVREGLPAPPRFDGEIEIDHYPSKGFPDQPSNVISNISVENCEQVCSNDSACIAYTFFSSSGLCKMFDSPGEYFTDVDAESGVKVQKP